MDRVIKIEINGSYLDKDNEMAGVQGEANSTFLRIIFDDNWSGLAKKVTFWNAKGLNPVERTLTADLLTNQLESLLDYTVPIPGEPLEFEGELTFVIDGYLDGKRIRSLADNLKVIYAPKADNAGEPIDVTPTQAEQLQAQVETLLGDVTEQAKIATEKAEEIVGQADEAKAAAETATKQAEISTTKAAEAKASADRASVAEGYAVSAGESARIATEKANEATNASANAVAAAQTVTSKTEEALSAANTAIEKAQVVTTKAAEVEENTTIAQTSATTATTAASIATEQARLAEDYAEQAKAAAGGDYATNAALSKAVSDLETAIIESETTTTKKITAIETDLTTHTGNTTSHITAEERTAWNNKANATHNHSASDINSGTLGSDRLPTVPIAKGGTGATTATDALTNLGLNATATELNYMKGVTSAVQTQLNGKAASSHNQAASTITAGTLAGKVNANATAKATLTDSQVRDIKASTTDLTAGTSALTTGDIYLVYE